MRTAHNQYQGLRPGFHYFLKTPSGEAILNAKDEPINIWSPEDLGGKVLEIAATLSCVASRAKLRLVEEFRSHAKPQAPIKPATFTTRIRLRGDLHCVHAQVPVPPVAAGVTVYSIIWDNYRMK